MARNIQYQFLTSINENFKEGRDKHSMKIDGQMDGTRINSYSDRDNLKHLSANFSTWMKDNHREIKYVSDIKAEHIQGFLNEKAETVSQATLTTYSSNFNKLEKVVSATYGRPVVYQGFVTPPAIRSEKVRNSAMSKEDYQKMLYEFRNSTSAAKDGIQISAKVGLRVAELAKFKGKDINLEKGTIHVEDGKGGRDRDVPIRDEDKAYFADLKARIGDNERICDVKKGSINTAVRRCMERVGISKKYKDTNIHSIRKMYAQESYDRFRAQGLTMKESIDETSKLLGHGEDRMSLMKEYVLKIR
jgi:integrase